jgi:hypothetical protein
MCRLLDTRGTAPHREPHPLVRSLYLVLGLALIASEIFFAAISGAVLPMKIPESVEMNTSLAAVL